MRVLVTFAMEAEFAPWRERWNFVRQQFPVSHSGRYTCYAAKIDGVDVSVFLTGIANRKMDPGLRQMLQEDLPDVCISSGLAGALRPGLKPGEVVAAQNVASDNSHETVLCDSKLIQIARANGATEVDSFLTCDHILADAASKRAKSAQASVVEMESFAILKRCRERNIPCVAIRSISDTSDESLPLHFDDAINSEGDVSLPRILLQIARNPQKIPAAISFGKQSKQAAYKLADFLDRYVSALAQHMAQISATPPKEKELAAR